MKSVIVNIHVSVESFIGFIYVTGKTRNPAVREVPKRFQADREMPKIFQADREVPKMFQADREVPKRI